MRISNYSEPLDDRRQAICNLSPRDPQRTRLKRQFFEAADRLIQTAKQNHPEFDALNEHLKQLLDQARQLDLRKSREKQFQRELLNQCLIVIQASKKLWRDFQQGIIHEEAYAEALVQMYKFFMKHHANYDPEKRTVMGWLNYRLKRDWTTQFSRRNKQQKGEINFEENIDVPSNADRKIKVDLIYRDIDQWIDTDPTLKVPITKNTKVTFSYLLQQRFILELSWKVIAQMTGEKVPTLSAYYERHCRPLLIEFVQKKYGIEKNYGVDDINNIL